MVKRENPLTPEQQSSVQSNMYLVDAVIRTRIQTNESIVGLGYEDIRQEGCILLCTAVQTYNPEIAKLSTYATKVIYNGLISHCRKINKQESHISTVSLTDCPDRIHAAQDEQFSNRLAELELNSLLNAYAKEYCGVTRLGIEALLMRSKGMGVTDIARLYKVPPKYIGAWISRAKKQLKNNTRFLEDIA